MFDATFTGNAGGDPQTRQFKSGDTVTEVSAAVYQGYYDQNRRWVDQGTLWVDVALPDGVDPSRIHKGDRLLVTGPVRQRTYQGKDGTERTRLSCRARQVAVVPRLQHGGQQEQSQPQARQSGYGQQQGFGSQQDAWGRYK